MFAGRAARRKTSVDWFYESKLHLVVNDRGELLNVTLTPGNTDERQPVLRLLHRLVGKVFADRGYISQNLAKRLFEQFNIQLITNRRNLKNHLLPLRDKLLL